MFTLDVNCNIRNIFLGKNSFIPKKQKNCIFNAILIALFRYICRLSARRLYFQAFASIKKWHNRALLCEKYNFPAEQYQVV
tara:strand:- start:759 stop:1001 length:243 start_codon:yes stop_codon:yes gene_type:complete